jgi:hypothetical protein
MSAARPRVLFVYFTVTQRTLLVVEAMTDTLRKRGCDVQPARIEFTDPRYADRFSRFPFELGAIVLSGGQIMNIGTVRWFTPKRDMDSFIPTTAVQMFLFTCPPSKAPA